MDGIIKQIGDIYKHEVSLRSLYCSTRHLVTPNIICKTHFKQGQCAGIPIEEQDPTVVANIAMHDGPEEWEEKKLKINIRCNLW